jgi:hypothetical protein
VRHDCLLADVAHGDSSYIQSIMKASRLPSLFEARDGRVKLLGEVVRFVRCLSDVMFLRFIQKKSRHAR